MILYDILRGRSAVFETQSFFEWLGETLGTLIHFVIRVVRGVVGGVSGAVNDFLDGMARAIGMNSSIFSFALLILGLFLLYICVRAFIARSIVAGVVWALLGLMVLSWVVR